MHQLLRAQKLLETPHRDMKIRSCKLCVHTHTQVKTIFICYRKIINYRLKSKLLYLSFFFLQSYENCSWRLRHPWEWNRIVAQEEKQPPSSHICRSDLLLAYELVWLHTYSIYPHLFGLHINEFFSNLQNLPVLYQNLPLSTLLYADDLVLVSQTSIDLT